MVRKVTDKKQLDAFENSTPGTQGKYPWAEWTDGDTYVAAKDSEYKGKPESFRYLLRARATKLGMTVKVQTLENDEIMFRFEKAEQNGTAK